MVLTVDGSVVSIELDTSGLDRKLPSDLCLLGVSGIDQRQDFVFKLL